MFYIKKIVSIKPPLIISLSTLMAFLILVNETFAQVYTYRLNATENAQFNCPSCTSSCSGTWPVYDWDCLSILGDSTSGSGITHIVIGFNLSDIPSYNVIDSKLTTWTKGGSVVPSNASCYKIINDTWNDGKYSMSEQPTFVEKICDDSIWVLGNWVNFTSSVFKNFIELELFGDKYVSIGIQFSNETEPKNARLEFCSRNSSQSDTCPSSHYPTLEITLNNPELKLTSFSTPSDISINQSFPINLTVYYNNTPLTNLTQNNFQLYVNNSNLSSSNFTNFNNGNYSITTNVPYNILGTYQLKSNISYQNQSVQNSTQIFIRNSTPIKEKILFISDNDWRNTLSLTPVKKPVLISNKIDEMIAHFLNNYKPYQIFLLGNIFGNTTYENYNISSYNDISKLFFNSTQGVYADGKQKASIASLIASLSNKPLVFNISNALPNYNFTLNTSGEIENLYLQKVKETGKNINYLILSDNVTSLDAVIASKRLGFIIQINSTNTTQIFNNLGSAVNKLNSYGFFTNNTEYLINGSYILILGNIPHITKQDPVEASWGLSDPLDGTSFTVDLEYGDLNNDTYIDVAVGRLPNNETLASIMFARTELKDNKTALVSSEYLHRNWLTILMYGGGGMLQGRTISKTLEAQDYQTTRLVEHRSRPLDFLASLAPSNAKDFLDQSKTISDKLAAILGQTIGAIVYKVLIVLKALQYAEQGLEVYLEYNWSSFGPKLSNAKEYLDTLNQSQNLNSENALQLLYILWPYAWKDLNETNMIKELQNKSIIYYEGIGNGTIWILPNVEPEDTGYLGWKEFLLSNQYNGSVNISSDEIPNITARIVWDNSDLAVNKTLFKSFLERGATSFIGASAVNYAPFSSEIDSRFFKYGSTVGNALMNAVNEFRDDWIVWDPLNVLKPGIKAKALREFILYGDPSLDKDPIIENLTYTQSVSCDSSCQLNISIPVNYSIVQTQNETTITVDTLDYLLNLSSPIIPLKTFEYFLLSDVIIKNISIETSNRTFYNITLPELDLLSHTLTNMTSSINYTDWYPNATYRVSANSTIDNRTRIKFVHTALQYNESNKTVIVYERINLTLNYSTSLEFSIKTNDITIGQQQNVEIKVWSNYSDNVTLYLLIENQTYSQTTTCNKTINIGQNTLSCQFTPVSTGTYRVKAFLVKWDPLTLGPRESVFTVSTQTSPPPSPPSAPPSSDGGSSSGGGTTTTDNKSKTSTKETKTETIEYVKKVTIPTTAIKEKQAYVFCGNDACEEGENEENCPEDCKIEGNKLPTGMFVLTPTKLSLISSAVIMTAASVYFVRKTIRKKKVK